jgi:hypothetical protein
MKGTRNGKRYPVSCHTSGTLSSIAPRFQQSQAGRNRLWQMGGACTTTETAIVYQKPALGGAR